MSDADSREDFYHLSRTGEPAGARGIRPGAAAAVQVGADAPQSAIV